MTRANAIAILLRLKHDWLADSKEDMALDTAIEALREHKKGKWRVYEGEMTCSCCETTFYADLCEYIDGNVPRFCPYCGADMRGEEDD